MSRVRTEDRIRELVSDLSPVSPIPPLWAVGFWVVALGLVVKAVEWLRVGPDPAQMTWLSPPHVAMAVGLAVLGCGSIAAALASAVPGRDARRGAALAVAGAAFVILADLWGALRVGGLAAADPIGCFGCLRHSIAMGLAPALAAWGFVAWISARRDRVTTALSIVGGVALGAAGVHLTCANELPLHWGLGHAIAPAVAAALGTVPLAALATRRRRRRAQPS